MRQGPSVVGAIRSSAEGASRSRDSPRPAERHALQLWSPGRGRPSQIFLVDLRRATWSPTGQPPQNSRAHPGLGARSVPPPAGAGVRGSDTDMDAASGKRAVRQCGCGVIARSEKRKASRQCPKAQEPRACRCVALGSLIPAASYSPIRRPYSTIGAGGLNFRVRDGNGCDPSALATGNR
jgi:hypothetical protein